MGFTRSIVQYFSNHYLRSLTFKLKKGAVNNLSSQNLFEKFEIHSWIVQIQIKQ